jgi:hypothetical protein
MRGFTLLVAKMLFSLIGRSSFPELEEVQVFRSLSFRHKLETYGSNFPLFPLLLDSAFES